MDRETGEPADDSTIYRVGSITKSFIGIALLLAQRDGRLSLDQPVRDRVRANLAKAFPEYF